MFKFKPTVVSLLLGILVFNINFFTKAMEGTSDSESEESSKHTSIKEFARVRTAERAEDVSSMFRPHESTKIVRTPAGPLRVPRRQPTVPHTEEAREQLLKNYMPTLSTHQRLGFLVGQERKVLEPAAHLRDKDGREKIVIYNSELPTVFDIFRARLQAKYDEYIEQREEACSKSFFTWLFPTWQYPSKDYLLTVADKDMLTEGPDSWPRELRSDMEGLTNICVHLRHVMRCCGDVLDGAKTICAFKIDVEAVNTCDATRPWIERIDTPKEYYEAVEAGFYQIANSSLSDRDEVLALDYCLDELLHRLNPRASDEQTVNFCFALNRVDYYLSRLEKNKRSRTPAELEVMDKLRRKIESLYLEHRFLFVRGEAPILGIPINDGQIIAKNASAGTFTRNVMFIDRTEIQERFIKRIEDALDTRFSTITRRFDFQQRSPDELRALANELRPESYQEMIDKMQEQILSLEEEEKRCIAAVEAKKTKVAIKVAESGVKLAVAACTGGTSGAIGLATDTAMRPQSAIADHNFTEQDVRDYLSEEERLKSSQQTVDPLHCMLDGDFTDPKNIVVDSCPSMAEPQETVDRGFPNQPITVRQPHFTAIGRMIQEQGLRPGDVDELLESMNQYLRSLHIRGLVQLRRGQHEFLKHLQQNEAEYQNLFSLYIKMLRHNFPGRTDFSGAIIEEHIPNVSDARAQHLREYFVYEVQRLEDYL